MGDIHKNNVEYFQSSKMQGYKHSWSVKMGSDSTVFVQADHNAKTRSATSPYDVRIEFNPSDYADMIPELILWYVFKASRIRLKRVDVAYDIKVSPDELVAFDNRKTMSVVDSTRYYGKRGNNQLVIYDKAKELLDNKVAVLDHALTRIEYRMVGDQLVYEGVITKGIEGSFSIENFIFPDIYYMGEINGSKPDLALLVKGAILDPILYKALTPYKRRKMGEYLKQGKKIAFSSMAVDIEKAVNKYISDTVELSKLN